MKENQVKCRFLRRRETGVPGENLSVQSREPLIALPIMKHKTSYMVLRKALSTRIGILLIPQLFLFGYAFRPHLSSEFAGESGTFWIRSPDWIRNRVDAKSGNFLIPMTWQDRAQFFTVKSNLKMAAEGNIYGLLTKREVKMTGYWPSSFFACLWTETKSRSINTQKKNEANIQSSWPNNLGQ